MDDIRGRVKTGEIDKTVNIDKQNRHNQKSVEYVNGRSYLLDGIDAQSLVDKYHGTGETKFTEEGKWKHKEVIATHESVGVLVNSATGVETITNSFTIHYSKTGVHIVPAPRREHFT